MYLPNHLYQCPATIGEPICLLYGMVFLPLGVPRVLGYGTYLGVVLEEASWRRLLPPSTDVWSRGNHLEVKLDLLPTWASLGLVKGFVAETFIHTSR